MFCVYLCWDINYSITTSFKTLKLFHCSCATSSKLFFFPSFLSELVTLQMWNANTLTLSCCLKNATNQRFSLRCVSAFPLHLPSSEKNNAVCLLQDVIWGRTVLVKRTSKRAFELFFACRWNSDEQEKFHGSLNLSRTGLLYCLPQCWPFCC